VFVGPYPISKKKNKYAVREIPTHAVVLPGDWLALHHGPVVPARKTPSHKASFSIGSTFEWDSLDDRWGWGELVATPLSLVYEREAYAYVQRTGRGVVLEKDTPAPRKTDRRIAVRITSFFLPHIVCVSLSGKRSPWLLWLTLGRVEDLTLIIENHQETPWGL